MGRTRLAKAGIAQLKSQIQQAQRRKKHLLDYLSKLEKAHSEKKISYAHYVETLHKKHNGRNIHELIHYYGHHIKECEKHLKHHKKQVHIGRAPAYAVGILIILALMFFSSPSTFKFTGFFVSEGENATAGENATGIEEITPEENITIIEEIPSENITTPEINITTGENVTEVNITNATGAGELENFTLSETNITTPPKNITKVLKDKDLNISIAQNLAILYQPVKWITSIKSETTGKAQILIPQDAQNIKLRNTKDGSEKKLSPSLSGPSLRIEVDVIAQEDYEIEYETPAPTSIEETLSNGKKVTLSSPDSIHYTNVLAFTNLQETLKVTNPSKIKIRWVEQNTFIQPDKIEDKNSNGFYDYVEWTVPSLSTQTFEIIVITKAEHLDKDRNFISDIYEQVKAKDNIWSETIPNQDYVRVTFERNLTKDRDITIFPRKVQGNPRVEVYEKDSNNKIAEFSSITDNQYNKILLTELGQGQCYDSETEIFTDKGWKLFNKLTKEEKVMTLNQKTGEKEWQKPTDYQTFKHNEEMYEIVLEDESEMVVSPKHKVYASLSSFNKSLVDNTLISDCCLNAFSSDQMGVLLNANDKAKYESSLVSSLCGESLLASNKNSLYSDSLATFISCSNNEYKKSNSESSICENFINFCLFLNNSSNTNFGDINSQSRFSNSSITYLLTDSSLKKENNILASTINTSGIDSILSQSPCLLATLPFKSPASSEICLSVNSDLESMLSASENCTLLTNCLITLAKANLNSSLSSDGTSILTTISSIGEINNKEYLNLPNFSLHPITKIYEQINQGEEVYTFSKISNNSRGDSILTFVCFLSPLSPENIPQLYFNASAKYGASFKFNSSTSESFSKNSEDGIKVICFLMNSSESFNSSFERWVFDNNLSLFLSSSDAMNSGAMNSNLLNNLLFSKTSKLLPFFTNAENTTFTSTTSSIDYLFDFNSSEYLLANDRLTSSANLSACSSVSLDLETMRFIRAISSSSTFTFFDSNNCQFIFFANASSFNSSGSLMVTSSMENKDDSNYINLSDFKLIPVTQIYNELNQGKEIYFLNENNEPVKVKSIEKIPYNGKIYGVDVENDIVLVRRGSENATAFWSGNSEGYSQDTFDLKVLGGSLELDHIIDPTQFKAYYNFSNTTHNTAYWGSPAAVRDLVGGTIATALQYGNLSQNDSKVAKVVADTGNDEPYWRFNFTIIETASTIDWIFVNISGRGNGTGGGETETAYVLNSSAAQYVSMGALLQSAVGIEFVSKNFTGSTEISNIINTSTKALVVYIEGVNYDTNDELAIDYAEVIVAYSLDQRAPYWYDASTNNTNPLPGANVSHNINWTDDVDLDYAILEINSTGTNCNTAANMSDLIISGAVAWSNISWATDQRCEGKMISWKQYANDSSNNWNVTSAQTYTVQNVNPTASFGTNQVNNSNSTSSSVFFELSCTDNLLVNKTQLWTNFTGTWHANQTNSTPVDGVTWNVSVAGIADGNYIWAAWCNDTLNNQDYENTNRTLKVDATGPSLSSANSNTTSVATSSYFCLNVTASDSLSTINQVFAQITNTTATANYTMSEDGTTCDGTASDGIYGVEITSTATGIVNYTKVFANDSLNNIGTLDFSDISITVTSSNTAPQVQIVGNDTMTNLASSGPNEGPTPTYVMINFTAYDAEGFTDLNMSSARINFTLSGESPRYNSCTSSSNYSTNYANFTCNVTVYWFDGAGTWSINATISDAGSTLGKNDTANFYIGALDAFAIAPTAMTWGSITAGLTDQNASNNPITLNNTGNVNKNISVNATNLRGEIDSAFALWAGNFSVSAESACRAQNMTDHSFVNITSATLPKGNFTINNGTTGQEKITICLNLAGSELIAQSHSTANEGAWTIKIVLAALSTRLTRRKKKKAKDSRLVDALGLIMDELKEEYLLDKKELTEIIVSKLKTRYKINKKEVIDMIKSAEEVAIPSAIFSKELGALESIVKYMKENLSMNYKEISERLERNERTIWTAYKKASEKTKSLFEIKEVEINIPIEVFKNSKLTVLESAIIYLKEKGFKYSEISRLLNRDQRNIRTACIRAINKKK